MLVMTAESGKKGTAPAAAWWTQPPVSAPTKDASSAKETTRLAKPKRAQLVTDGDPYNPLRCPVCSRAHPSDAYYCYFDGKPLHKDLQSAWNNCRREPTIASIW
jgi:hypothetical protein